VSSLDIYVVFQLVLDQRSAVQTLGCSVENGTAGYNNAVVELRSRSFA